MLFGVVESAVRAADQFGGGKAGKTCGKADAQGNRDLPSLIVGVESGLPLKQLKGRECLLAPGTVKQQDKFVPAVAERLHRTSGFRKKQADIF